MKLANKCICKILPENAGTLAVMALLFSVAPNAAASNMGNLSAAIAVWAIGASVAFLISLIFALKRNQDGTLAGLEKGKFFLLFSVLLLIVFVAGVGAIFIFMKSAGVN